MTIPSCMSLLSRAAVAGLLFSLAACASPTLEISAQPNGTRVYLDGSRLNAPQPADSQPADSRNAEATKPALPYYGTRIVRGHLPDSLDRLPQSREVTIDEPFSPWLFPLDFVLETVTYPFRGGRYRHRTAIALPVRPALVIGIEPASVPALRARAEQALRARSGREPGSR